MTKVLVLSNLPISVFEHKNMFYVSFVLSLKIIFYRYIGISVNFYNGGFLSLVLVSHFTQFEINFLCSKSLLHLINIFSGLN